MKTDPAIEAIREVRHRISASVDHDPWRLVEHYKQRQQNRGHVSPTRIERPTNDRAEA